MDTMFKKKNKLGLSWAKLSQSWDLAKLLLSYITSVRQTFVPIENPDWSSKILNDQKIPKPCSVPISFPITITKSKIKLCLSFNLEKKQAKESLRRCDQLESRLKD